MPHAQNLFEKFNAKLNKTKSIDIWKSICVELEGEGIKFDDWFKLKENVRNWYGRAIVSGFFDLDNCLVLVYLIKLTHIFSQKKKDGLSVTGAQGGKENQLNEFEMECLAFVRACKGTFQIDDHKCILNIFVYYVFFDTMINLVK